MHADRSAAEQLLRAATVRAQRLGRPVLASWTQPSPLHDALAFFAQAQPRSDRVLWLRPETGEALVGVGAAQVLIARGADRFKQVAAAWQQLTADAVVEVAESGPDGGPRLIGGFSFDPLRASTRQWKAFTDAADARLVLPEQLLVLRGDAAWLTTNVIVNPDQRAPAPSRIAPEADAGHDAAPLSPSAWKALVGSVAAQIRDGRLDLEKVVLARAQTLHQPEPIDPVRALRRLAASYPSCTVFAIAHADACFLGATPERLINLRHGTASTMALAGSTSRGATAAEDEALAELLLHDPKERAEHAVVVSALRDGMAQVCTRVVADAQPRIHKLPNLQHLLTPIRGQVSPGRGVLDLVERLHPTPAMGGFPRQAALALIRRSEGLDRGWYAGPIGWVNRQGEGEFVVGIRSALIHGPSATLFAGCGIVAESSAAAEYAESDWKLQPMLAALGVDQER